MKPCSKCKYAALCLTLGGASEVARHLIRTGTAVTVVTHEAMKYADGTPAPIMVNVEAFQFYRSRPEDCPGSHE